MIIIQKNCGLGNQLFQYAAGRRLAWKHNTRLLIDITQTGTKPHEFFALDHYNIKAEIIDKSKIMQFYDYSAAGRISRKIKTMAGIGIKTEIGKFKRICEKEIYVFDKSVLKLPDNVFLRGFWQSEKYFLDAEDIIRDELSLKTQLSAQGISAQHQIKNLKNTVSVHIRRGDNVTDKLSNRYFGLIPLEYYYKCLSHLYEKFGSLNIFVFSDDPVWAKENLISDNPMFFIAHNDYKTAYEDIHLMSLCEHNIIANSSFSWWGAWLNKNKEKIVFSPKQWLVNLNKKFEFVPDNWLRI